MALPILVSLTLLNQAQMAVPSHHLRHVELFGRDVPVYNREVLAGVDRVQATALDGGGYFIGIHAKPAESPVGFALALNGKALISPPRSTSYCSGSSYAAFIEGLDMILGPRLGDLSSDRLEALRMQEPNGGRREDRVKAWGWWNADGWGNHYALVQYLGAGERIPIGEAQPGDFVNISWKSGLGHSTVFLGWGVDSHGERGIRYWSSQTGTNGFGDQFSLLSKVKELLAVRLTHPEKVLDFDPSRAVETKISGDAPPIDTPGN
ncbi:hypothetical protein [Fimbriimonas ginsengisoli]|uniref:Uncharacterized protein n=1 Tax=Fimbriimonas ginsengisoli Gsoil 348 TaxID=661478 RepID=A0A068NU55_FIMGI|nr:hypothetical protein [Fimbriimonas ginsengisoli]AIE85124.1 hypothetical protein OP10G_1756 [Fimbriimonas ginsengisoli Gsoil 348]